VTRRPFDAFIEYRTIDGRLCALGIETKLAEPFSQKKYDGEPYRRWMRMLQGIWRPEADARVQDIQHNQLWRDHLLAIALRHHSQSPYATTRLLIVHHPEDLECHRVYEGYRSLLNERRSLIGFDVARSDCRCLGDQRAGTGAGRLVARVRMRYLELDRSAPFLPQRSPGGKKE
jgi:hypothetical protein